MSRCVIHIGDCLESLRTMPEASAHTCVTSPPYFNHRDYQAEGQIGLESTPEEYVERLVEVFREVRRVLRDDGTLWLNLSDSYSNGTTLRDCLSSVLKEAVVFLADPLSVAQAAHRVHVATEHQAAPDGVLAALLGTEGDGVEDGHQDFSQVLHLLAPPSHRRVAGGRGFAPVNGANAEVIVDEAYEGLVVVSELDAEAEAVLPVLWASGARAGEHHKGALPVYDTHEPSIGRRVVWHARFDSFALNALGEGSPDVHAVNDAIPLRDGLDTFAGALRDFRVAKASEEEITLDSVCGGLSLRVTDVGHLRFVLRDGSVVPYRRLYAEASSRFNRNRAKQELGIPERVKIALQEDGWICRCTVIWAKPNPMPESVTDRPTKAHEYLFLLTKQPRYYYDAEAVKEEAAMTSWATATRMKGQREQQGPKDDDAPDDANRFRSGNAGDPTKRNRRTVWEINTRPFPGAHFAVFPPDLIQPCIAAGTSERGCCPECGAPWERVVERTTATPGQRPGYTAGAGTLRNDGERAGSFTDHTSQTLGWEPTCDHAAAPVPCTVLDPFGGAGTTALVSLGLGRDAVLCELNPDYAEMAAERVRMDAPLLNDVSLLSLSPSTRPRVAVP